jgi:alkanesulfonate monooxygenase SsuD/methylene tetrahydromethanopterin reductase-like flavin-dependent oxidoreductase (luciferase family)
MAAALSQRIKRARIALIGSTLPLTNPVRVAEEYAMLDNLTGGRLVVGLLRGTPNEFLTYGTNPAETRAMYEEGIELVLKAWTEPQPFGWQGRHYQYRTISLWPRPLQQPHPPVFVSANSKESGSFAASHHLNMGLSFVPVPVAAQLSRFYQEQSRLAGWEPTAENKLYRGFIHVAPTDQQAVEDVQQAYWKLSEVSSTPQLSSDAGRGGIATATKPVAMDSKQAIDQALSAQSFAALGLQFCGSPQSVLRQIRHLHEEVGVGIIDFVFRGPSLSHEMTLRSLELFGKEVLPHLHEL